MQGVYDIDGQELIKLDFVTPEMYGAKADGVIDDTLAFKNMLAGGNKVVFLSPKTYKLSGVINVYSNTIIYGNNAIINSNTAVFMTGEEGDYAYGYEGTKNVLIRDLTLDINYARTDHIIMAHSENIKLYNCTLKNNVEHSIELNSSLNVTIANCKFINVAPVDRIPEGRQMEAINIDPAHTGHTLRMGYFDDTISDCVKIESCIFENCWCPVGNHGETQYASRNIIFKNNDVRGCYRGAQLHSYCNIFIENNFFDVSEKGIRLIGAHDVTIAGNNITATDSAISVENATKNVFVRDNIISTNAETPISTASAASGIVTARNIVNDALVN